MIKKQGKISCFFYTFIFLGKQALRINMQSLFQYFSISKVDYFLFGLPACPGFSGSPAWLGAPCSPAWSGLPLAFPLL